jgi:hypothetical protein
MPAKDETSAAAGLHHVKQALLLAVGLVSAGLLGTGIAGPAAAQDAPGETTLRGFVTDAASGQPLAGANIALLQPDPGDSTYTVMRGTAADGDGLYQLVDVAPGRYLLRVSFVGYRPALDTLQLGSEPFARRNVALQPAGAEREEVVVKGEQAGAARLEAGLQKVRPEDLQRIPTPGVGGDLATYLQSLPGVVSLGDRGGQLYIRGGTPDQNLVLADGNVLYQPFHIVGFFSAFPQELIQSTSVYAGGFPAKYTGRISSVIDVKMRPGNKKRLAAGTQVGPFLTGLRLEGPLTPDGDLSLIGSVRRSVIEETAPTLLGEQQQLQFSDAYGKLDYRSERSSCGLTGMRTYDRGRIDPERTGSVFRWSNTAVGGRCLAFASTSSVTADVRLGFSRLYSEVGAPSEQAGRSSTVWRIHSDVDLERPLGPKILLRWGFRGRYSSYLYDFHEKFTGFRAGENNVMQAGAHAGADLHLLNGRLDAKPSVAFTAPFDYAPSLELRLRVAWRPFGSEDAGQLNGAVGLYRQPVVGVSDERDAGSVFRAWLPTPVPHKQAQAVHALLGWQQRFGGSGGGGVPGLDVLDLSIEGYYKRLNDLPVPLWSAIARFTTELRLGDGDVYGFDVRLEGRRGPLYGYVGYGFSWTKYRFTQDIFKKAFGDKVQSYHPPQDRRHTLNAALSAEWKQWQAGLRWKLGTGRPYTRPIGFDNRPPIGRVPDVREQIGLPRLLFEKPYRGRLPTYHRLDLSLKRTLDLGPASLTAEGGAINLYNRRNLFYFDIFNLRRVDELPLVPYLSLKIETP